MITTEWILVLDQVILHTHPSLMMRAVHTIIGVLLIVVPSVHAQQGRIATIITADATLNKLGGGMKFTGRPDQCLFRRQGLRNLIHHSTHLALFDQDTHGRKPPSPNYPVGSSHQPCKIKPQQTYLYS